jgi:hypothetical protein
MFFCTGLTPTSFASFLKASVEGCGLELHLCMDTNQEELLQQLRDTYDSMRQSLGPRAVPYWLE